MAKSEHQGLQISLILFVMISVVLAITTFVYYRQSEEAAKREDAAKKATETATTRANDFQAKFDFVLHILGITPLAEADVERLRASFGSDETMKNVIKSYDDFVLTFGAGLPKDKQNFISVAPEVLTTVVQRNAALLQVTDEAKKSATDADSTRASEAQRTDVAVKGQTTAEKKLDEELAKYASDRAALEAKQVQELNKYVADLNKKASELEGERKKGDDLKKTITINQTTITDQRNTIKTMRDEPFEVADGQVTWVNQGANTVWINLGLADGLRRQTLFSVYDQADNGVTRTERKASIEVTRVIDQHLAEARIIADVPANPILQGDQIFSPAWRPGRRVRFALAGFMDIDGDSRSDRNLIRSLLSASGGYIDAELHDDGSLAGEISASTRYLVLGAKPDERTDAKVLAGYSAMLKKAEELGVEVINVEEMLDWVGYHPEVRSVGLGKNADPNQFKPKPPEGKSPTFSGNVSDKFRDRKPSDKAKSTAPPAPAPDSAFDK